MVSDQLSSVHIYNELYAEIDGRSVGPAQINPYATSRTITLPTEAGDGPSTSRAAVSPPLTPEELDKLYAKIHKRSRVVR